MITNIWRQLTEWYNGVSKTSKEQEELILEIELVPETSWCKNMRKELSKTDWDKIRKNTYADYGHKCGICKSAGRLNCHEIWEYDDKKSIQKLLGLIALCDLCHHVKHIAHTRILAEEGKLDFDKIVNHFMKVNNCNRTTFEEHTTKAFDIWHRRSEIKWQVDFGKYGKLINT